MVSQGMFSIGGIASGLDTTSIIDQLMKLERQPLQRLVQRQDQLGRVKDAWGQVNTKLSTLRAATDKINRVDRFDSFMSVASSDTDAVAVSASGTTDVGNRSFTVDQLARSMQSASGDTFASPEALIDGRRLSITAADGTTHDITADLDADATLDDLVAAVNEADIGVRASALNVGTDEFGNDRYRLVLDATATGRDGAFTFDAATGWGTAFTSQAARDAQLTVGGVTVTRSANTIDDLVEGATLTLKQTTTDPVTVSSQRDLGGAVAAVKAFTDAVSGVLTTLEDLSAYDPESKKAGPLQGDASARRLVSALRDAISRPIAGLTGSDGLASDLGMSFARDGSLEFDEAVLRQAFTDDFAGTAARLGRAGSTTDAAATFLNATSASAPGTYEVVVGRAADVARRVGAGYAPPGEAEPKTFRVIAPDGQAVNVTITSTETTVAAAVDKINEALVAADQESIVASVSDSGEIQLESTGYGSAVSFSFAQVLDDGSLDTSLAATHGLGGTHTGVDVEGTIGGLAATGSGRTLTGTEGDATGIAVQIDDQPAAFDVTWTRGVVGELGTALARAEGIEGAVSRARQAVDRQVEIYQTRIDGFEQRLITREATIRRQFVGMETMLGQLNAQGNWLGQQLAGLHAQMQQ